MSDDSKLILEGGAGGHMAHPFELRTINTGSDLKDFFFHAAAHLQSNPGATKIDGTNVSFKLVGQKTDQRQFAIDRGSLKEIDVNGVTIDRVSERFKPTSEGEEHGMVRMCGMTLRILNSAIEEIQPELEALGMWDNPSIYINAEFVEGTTNVTKYDYNFLALHVVQQFYQKTARTHTKAGKATGQISRPGLPRPNVVDPDTGKDTGIEDKSLKSKILTQEDGIDPGALDRMVKKLRPFAEKFNFKVYSQIPTQVKNVDGKDIELTNGVNSALKETFTVRTGNNSVSKTLEQWLATMDNKGGIPKATFVTTPSGKSIAPLSKACYLHISSGEPVENMILGVGKSASGEPDLLRTPEVVESEFNSAIFGAAVTEVTRVLGNAIMDGLETEGGIMGDMSGHEGIVLKDKKYAGGGFVKITGEFIVSGATGGGFGEKPITIGEGEADEEELNVEPEEEEEMIEPPKEDPGLDLDPEPEQASHKRRLVVFPGKFKPPHRGHLALVANMSQHLVRPQDRVLVLISPLSVKTDDGLEISAKDSKKLWKLYLESRNLSDKVNVLISPINSPVQAAYAALDNEIDGFETLPGDFIIPGASTKIDPKSKKPDWIRFERFSSYRPKIAGVEAGDAEEWAVAPFVDESGTEFSATNFRMAIDNREGVNEFLPDGISEEMFFKILTNTDMLESNQGDFQRKMKSRLSDAHKRLLDFGGQANSAPYTQKREKNKSNAFLAEEDLEEMSSMSGASAGVEVGTSKTKKKANYSKGRKKMSYEQFAEEIKLRNFVKENLSILRQTSLSKKRRSILENLKLKNVVTELIYEVAVQDTTDDPHESTGINKLEQLLKNIIPSIEEDYKALTTSEEQRKSFRAHILQAVKHLLAPAQAIEDAEDEPEDMEVGESDIKLDFDIRDSDEDKFIDIYDKPKDQEDDEDPIEKFSISGEDETGRNAAYECFQKIENQILKAFKILGNDEDREMFYDYLLTNLKLYFDRFDDDLTKAGLVEPTTPEYEKEKQQTADSGELEGVA